MTTDFHAYQELFLSESREILTVLNKQLVILEKNPKEAQSLNEIFRQVHTLKGMAATMGYEDLSQLCHDLEELLDKIRQKKMGAGLEVINLLFEATDAMEFLVEATAKGEEAKEGRKVLEDRKIRLAVLQAKLTKWKDDGSVPSPTLNTTKEKKSQPIASKADVQTVRIRLDQLDALMDSVGELVIHNSRLFNLSKSLESKPLQDVLKQVGRITDELQNRVMQVRMIPLETIFNRFPRMVRDLAQDEKKDIDLVMEGQEIGLDRTLLDEISEPLIHLLRNAVNHGIETPALRKKMGKSERGVIRLSASREKQYVVIAVEDDGQGMDANEIKQEAITRGLLKKEDASQLKDEETWMLITSPGFSTAQKVTNVSGRGVGMNTVRSKVESFGGILQIESTPQKGSRFLIKLPLSLAIVQALLVRSASETYAIPLANVTETIKISSDLIRKVEGAEMISWREEVLPLIRLSERLSSRATSIPLEASGMLCIVLMELNANKKVGLIVDAFLGQQEVVIKALKDPLKNIRGVAGATILGDGRVAMIADIHSIV